MPRPSTHLILPLDLIAPIRGVGVDGRMCGCGWWGMV